MDLCICSLTASRFLLRFPHHQCFTISNRFRAFFSGFHNLSKPTNGLRKFLRAHCDGETLAIADSKLGNVIKDMLQVETSVLKLYKAHNEIITTKGFVSSHDIDNNCKRGGFNMFRTKSRFSTCCSINIQVVVKKSCKRPLRFGGLESYSVSDSVRFCW